MLGVEEQVEPRFAEEVGRRLRAIRRQQRLSLEEVELRSGGKWSASAVGAYERGYRNLSLTRLRELAEFYGVPMSILLGEGAGPAADAASRGALVLDLAALDATAEAATVARYAQAISLERGDFNGRILSLRRDDARVLSTLLSLADVDLLDRLAEWGVLAGGPAAPTAGRAETEQVIDLRDSEPAVDAP